MFQKQQDKCFDVAKSTGLKVELFVLIPKQPKILSRFLKENGEYLSFSIFQLIHFIL